MSPRSLPFSTPLLSELENEDTGRPPGKTGFAVCDARHAGQASLWKRLWDESPPQDVFAHPGYVQLFCGPGDRALCATWVGTEGRVLLPFVLRDLKYESFWDPQWGTARDLVTPYGYGGAVYWDSPDVEYLAALFWSSFDRWAAEQHVASQFVRFSLFEEALLPYRGVIREDRKNVIRDLTLDGKEVWNDFRGKVRKNVNKAGRVGLRVTIDTRGHTLSDFLDVYYDTMRRRKADNRFFFPREFFERLQADLSDHFAYIHVTEGDTVVSTELLLLSRHAVYSFLGGSSRRSLEIHANDLLKCEAFRWAASLGKRAFVLGGGHLPDDGVFRYKTSFAPRGIVPFYVGTRIQDAALCHQLMQARRAACPDWQPSPGFFPPYRA